MNQDTTLQRANVLEESIKELECVNKKLAKLTVRKEELTSIIIDALGHKHEGQRSYEYGVWKIECKTPMIYSLNKKAYEMGDVYLPSEFDPIKKSVSYTVDKNLCETYLKTAPASVRAALIELIEKKPSKPGVSIKERI